MSHFLLATSYFLHLIATVIWIGGMSLLVLVIYPLQGDTDQPVLNSIERRFRPLANFSLLVLLMTGVVQTGSDEHYGGWFAFDTTWSLAILGKHIAFIVMIVAVVFLQYGLAPALERARMLSKKAEVEGLRQREKRLMQVNFVLGVAVLIFTAIATAV